jgi:putative ABC transport system ATP-binding protein
MTARIEVDGVTKRWADGSGLLPTTFAASAGDLVVVRGRSGSGKSTLLGILAGLCPADAGTVVIASSDSRPAERSWDELTVVPQTFALADELTILENVLDVRPSMTRADVAALMTDLGLDHLAASTPDAVSMGERQRCAVARAVVTAPLVVLADEPTSHQDEVHGAAVLRCLQGRAAAGSVVVIATHDPEIVQLATVLVDLEAR